MKTPQAVLIRKMPLIFISQVPLPEESRERLLKEQWFRSTVQLRRAVEVMDVVLGFLSTGIADSKQPLNDYITNTLSWKNPLNIKVYIYRLCDETEGTMGF